MRLNLVCTSRMPIAPLPLALRLIHVMPQGLQLSRDAQSTQIQLEWLWDNGAASRVVSICLWKGSDHCINSGHSVKPATPTTTAETPDASPLVPSWSRMTRLDKPLRSPSGQSGGRDSALLHEAAIVRRLDGVHRPPLTPGPESRLCQLREAAHPSTPPAFTIVGLARLREWPAAYAK